MLNNEVVPALASFRLTYYLPHFTFIYAKPNVTLRFLIILSNSFGFGGTNAALILRSVK